MTDVKAIKGIGGGCDEEAVRVIEEAPVWNPGQQRGKSVKVRMVMPITFRLDKGDDTEPTSLNWKNPVFEVDNFSESASVSPITGILVVAYL